MKVVLFCGGLGMRLREYSESIPKPMVPVGQRPILWNIMKYYAHFGHKEFILCLGHKSEVIKNYFLNYNEATSNDFVLEGNDTQKVHLISTDIHDWRITFADTGLKSNIGQRLVAVKKYLENDDYFLATYADGLTDMPLDKAVEHAVKQGNIANFVSFKPSQSFDIVNFKNDDGLVENLKHITKAGIWINGGYFTFKKEIFDYIREGEELVYEPFMRLIEKNELYAYKYNGFFVSMDTFKEKQIIDDLYALGNAPWEVWNE